MTKKKYIKSQEIKHLEKLYNAYLKASGQPKNYIVRFNDKEENGLAKCIITYVNMHVGCFSERVVSTGRSLLKDGQPILVRNNNTTGQADISMIAFGRGVRIEVKCDYTGDRYQSQVQKEYQVEIEKAYGTYFIARDFKAFYHWFNLKLDRRNQRVLKRIEGCKL